MRLFLGILILFFVGCDVSFDKNTSYITQTNEVNETNITKNTTNQLTSSTCVDVMTLGRVINALVIDANNNKAIYDKNKSKYCFNNSIVYPIKVISTPSTYIDVDFDNKKSANDIKPEFSELRSYFPFVDLVTTIHALEVDKNLSISYVVNNEVNDTNESKVLLKVNVKDIVNFYKQILEDKYPIKLEDKNLNEKILNFVLFDKNLTAPINLESDYFIDFSVLSDFFENRLNVITDKIKYYSFFHSLELLNKKLIKRIDTLHRPIITYLHSDNLPLENKFLSISKGIIVKDIKGKDNYIYVAGGFDGIYKFDKSLQLVNNIKINNTFSNMYELDILNTPYHSYVIGADGGYSLDFFNLNGFVYKNKIFWKYLDEVANKDVPITIDDTTDSSIKQIDDIISVKSYISPYGNKMWLAFGSRLNGVYLVDFSKVYPNLETNITYPMIILNNQDDAKNNLLIPKTQGIAISEEFSSDGQNLYVSTENQIQRYDLSSIIDISNVANTFNVKANKAYKLLMVTNNNVDELFVSTDKGVEVYDILNNGDLDFISKYDTEGAESGYYPRMSFVSDKNILLFTDGYEGLKAIRYDTSFNPELCGVSYFYPSSDNTKLAKVNAVYSYKDLNDGKYYVIVGVEGFGLIKFQLKDLLFKHCLANY